jgi:hypothetical protein
MEVKEDESLQNELKYIRKEKRKRSTTQKGEPDVFWNKKNNPRNNQSVDE